MCRHLFWYVDDMKIDGKETDHRFYLESIDETRQFGRIDIIC